MTHLDLPRRAASLIALAALAAVIALTSGSGAGAQTADTPAPGCAGMAATDADDDSTSGENTEILGLFFNTLGSRTTANIQIKNLTQDIPANATGLSWYVVWNTADGLRFVEAAIDFTGGPAFSYGTYDPTTGYSPKGETGGRFHEGPDGVIELQIPTALGAGRGRVLEDPYANATEALQVPGIGGFVSTVDAAPDAGGGSDYLVMPCEPPPAPAASPGAGGQTPAALPVTLATRSARARATRKRRLTLKLRASERVEDLSARLRKGSRTLGTGKRRELEGTGRLKLKLSRKLRKGRYVLEVAGTTGGRRASNLFNLKMR